MLEMMSTLSALNLLEQFDERFRPDKEEVITEVRTPLLRERFRSDSLSAPNI